MAPVSTPDSGLQGAPQPPASEIARRLPIPDLIVACQRATARSASDESFSDACGLELFRRAICEHDEVAWQAIIAQHRGLILAWARQHAAARQVADDGDYWVSRTFERFWSAVRPERWHRFTSFVSVLRYLKLCVHSVVLDDLRRRRFARDVPLETAGEFASVACDDGVLGDVRAEDLWQLVLRLLPDPSERLVADLSLVQGFAPREIQLRQPQRFATVDEVYRIKRNLLDRLRRSPELRRVLPRGASGSTPGGRVARCSASRSGAGGALAPSPRHRSREEISR